MRAYGRVNTSFWTNEKVRSLPEDARLMALYLLLSPHSNTVGAFNLPDGYAAADLGWTEERVHRAIGILSDCGFCERFSDGRHIVICNYLRHNPPENPNVAKAAVKQALLLPLKDPAMRHVVDALEGVSEVVSNEIEPLRKALAEQYSNGSLNPLRRVLDEMYRDFPNNKPNPKPNQKPDPEPKEPLASLCSQTSEGLTPTSEPLGDDEPIVYTDEEVAETFDFFWWLFPRKESEFEARKIFFDVVRSRRASMATIIGGADLYRRQVEQGVEPSQRPTDWLMGGGWLSYA